MNQPLHANRVFDLLQELELLLRNSNHPELAEQLRFAIMHYMPPLTSEFLGSAMKALDAVAMQRPQPLSEEQIQIARRLAEAIRVEWFSK